MGKGGGGKGNRGGKGGGGGGRKGGGYVDFFFKFSINYINLSLLYLLEKMLTLEIIVYSPDAM